MTPADSLAQHRAFLAELGENVVVRRYAGTGPARVPTDVTVRARVMGYKPAEVVGAVVQGDLRVIALADNLAALLPLKTTDFLVIRGAERRVMAIDDNTRRIASTLIALEIQARG